MNRSWSKGVVVPFETFDEPTLMSNFDHSADPEFEDWVDEGRVCKYAGRDFNGRVWKSGCVYYCQVWTYHAPRAVVSAPTVEDLMRDVSDEFGWA